MKAPRIGRPPIPKKDRKATLLSVRLTAAERKIVERAANKDGVGLSEWARRILLASAVEPAAEAVSSSPAAPPDTPPESLS